MQVHIIDMHHHASIFIWFYLYVCPHGGTLASYTTPPRHNRHRFLMVFARPGSGSTLTYTDIAPWNILEQVSSCSASRRPLDSFQVAPRTPPMPKALGEKKKRKENKERKNWRWTLLRRDFHSKILKALACLISFQAFSWIESVLPGFLGCSSPRKQNSCCHLYVQIYVQVKGLDQVTCILTIPIEQGKYICRGTLNAAHHSLQAYQSCHTSLCSKASATHLPPINDFHWKNIKHEQFECRECANSHYLLVQSVQSPTSSQKASSDNLGVRNTAVNKAKLRKGRWSFP